MNRRVLRTETNTRHIVVAPPPPQPIWRRCGCGAEFAVLVRAKPDGGGIAACPFCGRRALTEIAP